MTNTEKCVTWIGGRLCGKSCPEGSARCAQHAHTVAHSYKYVFPGEDTPTMRPPAMAAE